MNTATTTTATALPSDSQYMAQLQANLAALPAQQTLSDEAAEAIYALAYQELTQGRYDTALDYFSLLTLYRPTHPTYLQGLALCYRLRGEYEEAINLYAYLSATETEHLEHDLAIADCLLLQGHTDQAQEQVQNILQFCHEHQGHAKLAERAQGMLELLAAHSAA